MDWGVAYTKIQQLIGLQLISISGGADITLIAIDEANYVVQRADGRIVNRSTSELVSIAQALVLNHAVHVDSQILHGSGSSRSHPETVFANLPDVRWTRIQRRKHIYWAGEDTHALGTLEYGQP